MSEQLPSDDLLYRLRQRAARSGLIPCGEMVRITPEQCMALVECAEALPELIRISDRKHDVWGRAKAALAKLEAL